MELSNKYSISISAIFIWIGFVSAISFVEAWLKFRAPGMTLSLGLGIGRIVFNALNKIEWVLALIIYLNLFFRSNDVFTTVNLIFSLIVVILLLQTFWLLPMLDNRAELYIQGKDVPALNIHFYYIGMEAIKVIALCIIGFFQFKSV